MRERTVEKSLVKKGKARGIRFLKFKTPSRKDVPDRIAFLDNGITVFVECKRPGEEPNKCQERYIKTLIKKGHHVYVSDSTEEIEKLIDEIISLSEESD